jgi:hypothetical protein
MNDLLDGHDEKDEENLPHHGLTRAIFYIVTWSIRDCISKKRMLNKPYLSKASLSSISGKSFISGSSSDATRAFSLRNIRHFANKRYPPRP